MSYRRVVYWVSERCLRWFYREHRVVGFGRVPTQGAVLLVGNHPNDIPDVIAGLYLSPRHPRYIATVSAATNPIAKAMYEAMAVIPIVRVRDARKMKAEGIDLAALNQAANDTVQAALSSGDVVAVFPEGGVHDVSEIGRLRTGVAKMVQEHLDADAKNDVFIAPFGHQYEAPRRWRSDMLSVLGEPWSARAWLEAQPEGQRGAAAFTDRLRTVIRAVTRNSATWDEASTRDEVVAAAAGVSAPHDALDAAPQFVVRAAALAADAHGDGPSAHAVRVRTAAHQLARAVERAGGIGSSSVDMARLLHALDVHTSAAPVPIIPLLALLPVAAIGWALTGPILPVVHALAKKGTTQRADFVAACFVPGLYVVLLWWIVLALVAAGVFTAIGWSLLWALLLLVALPRLGDFAMRWKDGLTAWRLMARARGWEQAEREALREAGEVVREWAAQGKHTHPEP
jgi:1-acyl-sn-glycerol-3-phosphate acyltransferase